MKNTRIAELDGLRGGAVLVVMLSHYVGEAAHGTSALELGWLGVDLFFVLSGFLMGSIILENHTKPDFLKSFYLRRAARIVPVYFVVVCATLSLAMLTRNRIWADHPFGPLTYLLFVPNIMMSPSGGGGEWLKPTWTLAVEEQFYLLLPPLIIWTPKRVLMPVLLGLCASAAVFRFALYDVDRLATLVLLPSRMDLLLGGVVLAYVRRRFDLSGYLLALRVIPLIAALVLLGIVIVSRERLFTTLNPTLVAIAFASFLLAIMLDAPEGRRYRSPALRYFGKISYALYLVHQPISGFLHGVLLDGKPDIATIAQIGVTCLAAALSLAVAALSWQWFERPILKLASSYGVAPLPRAVPA